MTLCSERRGGRVTPVTDDSPRDPGARPGRSRLRWPAGITARLWGGLAVFIALVLAAATAVLLGIDRQNGTVDEVVRHLQPLVSANLHVKGDFADSQGVLRAYLLTREPRYFRLYQQAHASLAAELRDAPRFPAARSQALFDTQQGTVSRWFGYAARMVTLAPGDRGITRLTDLAYPSAGAFYRANA